jgi:hypothetical protein
MKNARGVLAIGLISLACSWEAPDLRPMRPLEPH